MIVKLNLSEKQVKDMMYLLEEGVMSRFAFADCCDNCGMDKDHKKYIGEAIKYKKFVGKIKEQVTNPKMGRQ